MEPQPSTSRSSTSENTPVKINPRKQKVIIDVYKNMRRAHSTEKIVNCLYIITKIDKAVINKVITTFRNNEKAGLRLNKVPKLTKKQKLLVRKIVHRFWINQRLVTGKKILRIINRDDRLPNLNYSNFYDVMSDLHFRYRVRSGKRILAETFHTSYWRYRYTEDIEKYRKEGRPIYYLDETCIEFDNRKIDQDQNVPSTSNEQEDQSVNVPDPSNTKQRFIVLHVVSEKGFLPGGLLCIPRKSNIGCYQKELKRKTFFKWFCDIESLLEPNAIIVMDNAWSHSKKLEERPCYRWSKERLRDWLVARGHTIVADESFEKMTMIIMIRRMQVTDRYQIDDYARQKEKILIRIPRYHGGLNPFEHIWPTIKDYVKEKDTVENTSTAEQLIQEATEMITIQKLQEFMQNVYNVEEEYRVMDLFLDTAYETSEDEIISSTETIDTTESDSN